jgi:hypothetical protein
MKLLLVVLGLSFSVSANAAWGDWQWFEADDELNIVCSYVQNIQYVGAAAMTLEIQSEDKASKSFSAQATVGQLYASEIKNGKEKEKFKFESKDGWPFGRTTLALKAAATIKFVPNEPDSKVGGWAFAVSAPFKSGGKEKKEVKSIAIGKDGQAGIKIDKQDYTTNCSVTAPACQELNSNGAANGYGAGQMRGCHTEGENVAKRYRGFRAFRTDMKDNLLAELKVYSYEYEGERRLNMEARLRNLGSSAHGWDFTAYNAFIDRLVKVTELPEDERAERLAALKETLAKALAGE